MEELAISLPFSIDSYGKVSSTTSQSKLWSDRVKSVLGTTLRERVMRPTLGTLIPYALFESASSAEAEVKSEIKKAFDAQLPLLVLTETTVTIDSYTNVMTASVVYDLPNKETVTTNIGLILIQGTKPYYEELL